jgi:hypothetical protein
MAWLSAPMTFPKIVKYGSPLGIFSTVKKINTSLTPTPIYGATNLEVDFN